MAKPVGQMNELDCLRMLIAALVGVDANGIPIFDQDTGTGGGLTNAQLRASSVPVISIPTTGALTDHSGTITAGATAQDVMAASSSRRYLFFQNNSDTDCWINFGVTAVANQPSIRIIAGGSYENPAHFCPTGRVSVYSATTGKTYTAKEA